MILFNACAVESGTDGLGSGMHLLELFVGKGDFKDAHNAVGADHAGHGERNVLNAVFAVHNSGRGENGVLIIEDALDEAASSHRDAGVGEALLVDDVVSDLNEFLLDSLLVKRSGVMEVLIEFLEREACATGGGPSDERRIAVLTENIAVDVLRIDFVLVGKDTTEAIGLEHGAGAEDFLARIIELSADDVGCDIERVGDENDDGVLGALLNLTEDGVHDLCVGAGELKSVGSLARADRRTCADDDDVGAFAIIVVALMDFDIGGIDTRGGVAGIGSFAPSLIGIEVDEYDFGCELEVSDFVDDSGADVGSTDDDDLSAILHYCSS